MNFRARQIIKVLSICLLCSTIAAVSKLLYGFNTNALAFVADGIHSLFDSSATVLGMLTVWAASRPPDENHPYGHQKFELLAALVLAAFLMFAAFEVGAMARHRLLNPDENIPKFSYLGLVLILATVIVNLALARYEAKKSKELDSPFLAADSLHNYSDIGTDLAALASLVSAHLQLRYIDAVVSMLIAVYLLFLSLRLIIQNMNPLVDKSILEPKEVIDVASKIEGVLEAHNVRSRGQEHHHFLDLNIHLPPNMTLEQAHEITHRVEEQLKNSFPGLVDVVIHTEPEGHPPCSKEDIIYKKE